MIAEIGAEAPDSVIVLGDTFGYYPWALETYRDLRELDPLAILGNHDQLVLDADSPISTSYVWEIAKQNERDLAALPEAMIWLRGLPPVRLLEFDETNVRCCHGTPDDPLRGRYYPDAPPEPTLGPCGRRSSATGAHALSSCPRNDGRRIDRESRIGRPAARRRHAGQLGAVFSARTAFRTAANGLRCCGHYRAARKTRLASARHRGTAQAHRWPIASTEPN